MTISLLDVLSCGLAVVVILLIVALNTGQGFDNDPQKITLLELNLDGDYDLSNEVNVKWNKIDTACFILPITKNLSKIAFSGILDTLANFLQSNIYAPDFGTARNLKNQKYDFLFHPNCRGLEISMSFYSRTSFSIVGRMSNVSEGKSLPRQKRAEKLSGRIEIRIRYRNGVVVQVFSAGKEISRWFIKNTA
jgi:hypothetical protein